MKMVCRCVIACSILFTLSACHRTEPVDISAEHWAVGDTTWFEVIHNDSVFGSDTSYLQRNSYKAVRLVVLSMNPAPRLEWQEFMLDSILDTANIHAAQRYWYPAMRIEYSCDPEGGIKDLLNFPELHAYMDTMTERYLDLVPSMSIEQRGLIRGVFLDSAWIMARSMNDVKLLHRCYGYLLTTEASPGQFLYHDLGIGPVNSAISLSHVALCGEAGAIGIRGTARTDSASIADILGSLGNMLPIPDSIGDGHLSAHITFTTCFNPSISLPSYLDQKMETEFAGKKVQKSTTMYINQRWNEPIQ